MALGLALGEEKRRRIDEMSKLPKEQQPKNSWKREHKSEETLRYLRDNVPPLELFPDGDSWTDPPKCMPEYLHNNATGNPFSSIESYQLFYSGNKVIIAELKWEPYVEKPDFLGKWQDYIKTRTDIQEGIQKDLLKDRETKQRGKERRAKKRLEKRNRETGDVGKELEQPKGTSNKKIKKTIEEL